MICHSCKYQLDKSYQFKKKCEAANLKLQKHFKFINSFDHDESQKGNNNLKDPSRGGKSGQIRNLVTNFVSIKHDVNQDDGFSINVTEEELLGGNISGKKKYKIFVYF